MQETEGQKTALVTGANRGIGLELCRQLAARGTSVIGVCRSSSDALDELDVEVLNGVDVSKPEDVEKLAGALTGRQIDLLVNNAGVLAVDSLDSVRFEDIEWQFQVNAMGPLRVAKALKGNIPEGGKIFVITSSMGSISENTSGGYYGYRMSKGAVNMAFKSLSVDLADDGIGVFMLHPGYVATDMSRYLGPVPVDESAAGLIARMDELDLESTGAFRHAKGREIAW